jgi:hypothetical protein
MGQTSRGFDASLNQWSYKVEWTITAAGAIVPNGDGTTTTDPEVSVVRASAGTYTVTFPGKFTKVLDLRASYRAAAGSSIIAQVTGSAFGPPATVTVITGNSNAVPAAADQAAGVVGLRADFQGTV